ncbi:MAG: hypothetical protein WC713_13685 [Candidatus Methylomirabilota bacterium]
MRTRNVSATSEVVAETRRTSGEPEVNHRAQAIQVIEKTMAPLFELRGFMQEHPDFTAAQFSGLWMKFEGGFENGFRLATDEVYNARGGSERIEFTRAQLPARFIDPTAPVRQRAQALVGAIAEQCEAMLTFVRSDPDGFDPAAYCTALDQVTKAVSRWGKLLGDIPYELMSA